MAKTKGSPQSDSFGKTEARERMATALRAALNMGPIPHAGRPTVKSKVKTRPKKKGRTSKD